jgi:hypothetical protein
VLPKIKMNQLRQLNDRFMALKEEEEWVIQQHAPHFRLRAIGVFDETHPFGHWEFSHEVSTNLEVRITLACADAASVVGCPDSANPIDYWIYRLFVNLRDRKSRCLVELAANRWQLNDFLEISATFLGLLEIGLLSSGPNRVAPQGHLSERNVLPAREVPEETSKPERSVRRNHRYEGIDKALRGIAGAWPKGHEEVFRQLENRKVSIPNRKPFKSAGGWWKGYRQDRHLAGAWLSQVWARLRLPPFARGPRK